MSQLSNRLPLETDGTLVGSHAQQNIAELNESQSKVKVMGETGKSNKSFKELVEAQAESTQKLEQEIKAQEEENDQDLAELKQKLQDLQQMPKPTNKDEMIDYLVKRLESAESAIKTSEEIIQQERQNRKAMSKDLKEKNAAVRAMIE